MFNRLHALIYKIIAFSALIRFIINFRPESTQTIKLQIFIIFVKVSSFQLIII